MCANFDFDNIHDIIKCLDSPPTIVKNEKYRYCSYPQKINIFTFGSIAFFLPFIVIAPPISIDEVGFTGDFSALIQDLKKKKSVLPKLYLCLNVREHQVENLSQINEKIGVGETLSSCIFYNKNPMTQEKFQSFSEYKTTLRSSYRRRIMKAEERGQVLSLVKIENDSFTREMYDLYLQVLEENKKYKLETLPIVFFQKSCSDIYIWKLEEKPVSFVMINKDKNGTYFIFGGMNYKLRDTYDLYYNMLLFILREGIDSQSDKIYLGQTAEETKGRLGCSCESRYLVGFSNCKFVNRLMEKSMSTLGYQKKTEEFHVFKQK